MKVLFFAQSREAAGCAVAEIDVERAVTCDEFWDRIVEKFSALAPFRRQARLARQEAYLAANEMLQPQDEIAILPPVSGG